MKNNIQELKYKEKLNKEISLFENLILDEVTSYDPMPDNQEEVLEYEQFKILRNFMTNCEYSIKDLFPLKQWYDVLLTYLPDEYKFLALNMDLIDYGFESKINYDLICEEYYNNIRVLFSFAKRFIDEKNKGIKFIDPVVSSNILKHVTEAIISEVYKFKYYKQYRKTNLNISV